MDDIDYCASCNHYDCEPHLEPCVSCKTKYNAPPTKFSAKKRTNADRIRAMSDEELAQSLSKTVVDAMCYLPLGKNTVEKMPKEMWDGLVKEYLEWLKQPAED